MTTKALTTVPVTTVELSKLDRKQIRYLHDRELMDDVYRFVNLAAETGLSGLRIGLASPVSSLVAAWIIIEWCQREGYIPELAGTILEGALLTEAALKSISDSGILTTLLPLIGALKGA